jgi:hypothetical protein
LTVSVQPGYLVLVYVHLAAAEVNLGLGPSTGARSPAVKSRQADSLRGEGCVMTPGPSLTEALPNGLLVQLSVRGGGPKGPL